MKGFRGPWELYSERANEFAERYESVETEQVHETWLHLLPPRPGLALDVGAGSGRDAAWLAERGWEVTAVEPAEGTARGSQPKASILPYPVAARPSTGTRGDS